MLEWQMLFVDSCLWYRSISDESLVVLFGYVEDVGVLECGDEIKSLTRSIVKTKDMRRSANIYAHT